jgi:hypothetical protein
MINDEAIELDSFVQSFIDHTVGGMLAALEETGEITILDLSVEGSQVTVNLNGRVVPTNAFVNDIIRNTLTGMVSSLKGVSKVDKMSINIRR